jgi:succinate dehydrogenase / fumarate reductase membrane anchor subunit
MLESDLKKAKGLGSAHSGTHHWLMQRITAIASLPLVIWLVYSVVGMKQATYGEFTTWLALPLNAILMCLFIIATFYHAVLGVQVVTEDYIAHKGLRLFKLIAQKLFFFAIGVASIFSILKIAFMASTTTVGM